MNKLKKNFFSPFALPIYFFALTIFIGTFLLHHPLSLKGSSISWLDALFTATSATCVTGLIVVDTGSFFSPFGQGVILLLIQLGGLGIMTYTSLVFYLWKRKVSITDRIAVGQSLLHDPSFHLGSFLIKMLKFTFIIEVSGSVLLYLLDNEKFTPFSAIFHSISAFCNAGFSLFSTSLMDFKESITINLIFIILIVLGGLGFAVILELYEKKLGKKERLSWHASVVLQTTLWLIVGGAILIFIAEFVAHSGEKSIFSEFIAATFQSITCRTAGFNSVDIGKMTNLSLLIMIFLMFIGGSPGSCAGGIKTTTFRALLAFGWSNLIGRKQCVIGRYALDDKSLNKALTLIIFALTIVFLAAAILLATEGGDVPHHLSKGRFIEILFEVVSAFGTVGLSTGITPYLTPFGKIIIIILMFIGRLGPILFLTFLQSWQSQERFKWPENSLLIG